MLLLPLLLGCSTETLPPPPERAVAAVEVLPGDAEVLTHAAGGEGLQLTAVVTYDDGEVVETRDDVEWASSNETAGTVDASGWFEPSTTNGGVTWVSARLDGVEGQVTLTVRYQEEWVEEGADADLFLAAADLGEADLWLYPEAGVNLPRNTPAIQFQWATPVELGGDGSGGGWRDTGASPGDSEPEVTWRLRFESALTDVTVYTSQESWTADEATWQAIASTNAGGTVTLSLAVTDGVSTYTAAPRSVQVNRFDADGAIVYWSTAASGFMRVPYGQQAEAYLTYEQTGHCMGCHAISRDGRIAFTYDGGNGPLGVKDMATGADLVPWGDTAYGNFMAWSPDGTRLVSTHAGRLLLWDTATWTWLGDIPIEGTATQVDWAPDGSRIVMAWTGAGVHTLDWSFTGGQIAVIDVLGEDRFGPVQVLHVPEGGLNAYYPAYSPDGEWIAFNTSTEDSYNDDDAQLWVMPAEGGAAIPLTRLNREPGLTNSWPRWGPLPDDDILWLAFSSRRTYGAVVDGRPQIWVSAFDPAVARVGGDPSFPAFWLPNQDPHEGNHIPVWTE